MEKKWKKWKKWKKISPEKWQEASHNAVVIKRCQSIPALRVVLNHSRLLGFVTLTIQRHTEEGEEHVRLETLLCTP